MHLLLLPSPLKNPHGPPQGPQAPGMGAHVGLPSTPASTGLPAMPSPFHFTSHSSGDSSGFKSLSSSPTLPLPRYGARVNYVTNLHGGKLSFREVKSVTSVTPQGWSPYLNLGDLTLTICSPYGIYGAPTHLGPYKPVPLPKQPRGQVTKLGCAVTTQRAGEARLAGHTGAVPTLATGCRCGSLQGGPASAFPEIRE